MAGFKVSIGRDLLPRMLNGQDGLAKLMESVLNQKLRRAHRDGRAHHGRRHHARRPGASGSARAVQRQQASVREKARREVAVDGQTTSHEIHAGIRILRWKGDAT